MDNGDLSNVIPLFRRSTSKPEQAQEIAIHWEAHFNERGLTLSDPKTAQSLQAAMDFMALIIRGACATEVITEEQRETLHSLITSGHFAIEEFGG